MCVLAGSYISKFCLVVLWSKNERQKEHGYIWYNQSASNHFHPLIWICELSLRFMTLIVLRQCFDFIFEPLFKRSIKHSNFFMKCTDPLFLHLSCNFTFIKIKKSQYAENVIYFFPSLMYSIIVIFITLFLLIVFFVFFFFLLYFFLLYFNLYFLLPFLPSFLPSFFLYLFILTFFLRSFFLFSFFLYLF